MCINEARGSRNKIKKVSCSESYSVTKGVSETTNLQILQILLKLKKTTTRNLKNSGEARGQGVMVMLRFIKIEMSGQSEPIRWIHPFHI